MTMQQKYWCNHLCNHNAFMHNPIYNEKHLQSIWLCWLIPLCHLSWSLRLSYSVTLSFWSFSSPLLHLFCTLSLSVWQAVFVIGRLLCWADSCSPVRLLSCQSSEMHITAWRRNHNITADINHATFTTYTSSMGQDKIRLTIM